MGQDEDFDPTTGTDPIAEGLDDEGDAPPSEGERQAELADELDDRE